MPACYFYYCMSLLISSCWMGGQLATGASDKRYNWLRQSKDSFKKENKCVIFLTLSLEVISALCTVFFLLQSISVPVQDLSQVGNTSFVSFAKDHPCKVISVLALPQK